MKDSLSWFRLPGELEWPILSVHSLQLTSWTECRSLLCKLTFFMASAATHGFFALQYLCRSCYQWGGQRGWLYLMAQTMAKLCKKIIQSHGHSVVNTAETATVSKMNIVFSRKVCHSSIFCICNACIPNAFDNISQNPILYQDNTKYFTFQRSGFKTLIRHRLAL